MLASGILGYTAHSLLSVERAGAAAVTTKSIGLKPRVGYANPTVVNLECGILNAMGLPNPGIGVFAHEIRQSKSLLHVPIVVSVYGFSEDEYASVAEKAIGAGADAVELNVSCPHVRETGSEIGQNARILSRVVRFVKAKVDAPVFVKLSPNVTSIVEMAEAAARHGADGLTVANTVRAMAIDVETALPILGNRVGGLSGMATKPIAVRCVYDVHENVDLPIIGCGGIGSAEDAVEFILAGASAVQIGSGIASKGIGIFRDVRRGIDAYLKKKGLRSVKEIVGLSHRK
jgi:dihydroorotate dehydrogenase (NAD+) catalytic subunit